jgi:ankyrin repeat protein/Tfp pilus assembly protein PilF
VKRNPIKRIYSELACPERGRWVEPILFSIVCISLSVTGCAEVSTSDKNAQAIESGSVSTTWMPGAEASVGHIKVHYADTDQSANGTGFLIASNLVVTCLHGVNGANSAEITFPSGLSRRITGIAAEDAENDLTILTITPTGAEPPPLPLSPVPAQVGDKLVMYGYPVEAGLSQKMCDGRVTCIGNSFSMSMAIFTDAPLTYGFSGGPALNDQRQVVGVAQGNLSATVLEGKEVLKKQGIQIPASCIASLSAGPSRSLKEWTKARGAIVSAAAEESLGQLDNEQEDFNNALQHFQKATRLDSNNYRAWYGLGTVLVSLGRHNQAIYASRKALALKPQFPEVLCTLGGCFLTQQRYPEAVDTFEKCLRMNPNYDRYHFMLGLAYVGAGQFEKAREQYQTLTSINPEAAEYLLEAIQQQLIIAAKNGNLTAVQTILANGADVNAKDTTNGATALMWASQNGHTEVVKCLLENGADVNVKDNNGRTALINAVAAIWGHTVIAEIVQLLIEKGADVNAGDNDGKTALMAAAYKDRTEIVKLLLEKGADINAGDNDGATILMLAADKGHVEVVKVLLEKGADVNAGDNDGATALIMAANNGHLEVVKLLLEKGADVNVKATINNVEWTALRVAKSAGRTDIVQLLEKVEAKE